MINRCERTIKMHYDYLVVGAGLYGAVFAHEAKKKGKTCLVIEKRNHIAGKQFPIYPFYKHQNPLHTFFTLLTNLYGII